MTEKYTPPGWRPPEGPFTMILNDVKVFRYFGRRPDLGKPVPGAAHKTVTVGVRQVFGKTVPDDKAQVLPTMALKRLRNAAKGFGMWEVKVEPEHKGRTTAFLLMRCGE